MYRQVFKHLSMDEPKNTSGDAFKEAQTISRFGMMNNVHAEATMRARRAA
jgi:hypothetical protein